MQKNTSISDFSPFFGVWNYPFGMLMPDRHGSAADVYRYGFQGQEGDDEIKGEGNSVNYKYRMHDPRIGRFFAVDPLANKYPFFSPYSFSGNQVIHTVELEGLEPAKYLNPQTGEMEVWDYSEVGGDKFFSTYAIIENGKTVSSYDVIMNFVSFVDDNYGCGTNRPNDIGILNSNNGPEVDAQVGGASLIFDLEGPIIDGSKKMAEELDNVWIKNKNGKWFQGSQVSSSKLLKGTFSRASKLLAKRVPIVGYALDGMEIAEGIKKDGGFGDNAKIETAGAAGGTLGGLGGAWAGAAAGAAIGSVIPVIGTVAGGIIGGIVGAIAGSWGGEKGAEAITEEIIGND